jgi:hypothetical protein
MRMKLSAVLLVGLLLLSGCSAKDPNRAEWYQYAPLYTWNGTAWNQVAGDITAANVSSVYVPYNGAISDINLNAKEVTNATLNNLVGKGTWTASGTWKLPAMYFNGDITSDRWLSSATNTFYGRNVAGAGTLAHTAGSEGWYNVGLGNSALQQITTGFFNTAVGDMSLFAITSGYSNTAYGEGSLLNLTDGYFNTGIGVNALASIVSGKRNVAVGLQTGHESTGNDNTFIGYQAGYHNTGNSSVMLGYLAGHNETESNKLYIANSNTATPLIGGDFSEETLDFNGTVNMTTHQIKDVVDPTLAQDAATKNYVDDVPYGQFMATTNQTVAVIDTAYAVAYDTQGIYNRFTHSTTDNNSRIYITEDGVYGIIISAIGDLTLGINQHVDVWLRVDGTTDVPNSNTKAEILGNIETVIAVDLLYEFTAGQYFEIMYAGSSTSIRLVGTNAHGVVPASPAVITTVKRIARD